MLESGKLYHYLGELGTLNLYYLGLLEKKFKEQPLTKIKLITYPDFGNFLEFLFPNNIQAIKYEKLNIYKRHACQHTVKKKIKFPDLLEESTNLYFAFEKQLKVYYKQFKKIKASYPPVISSPLSNEPIDNSKILNLQIRLNKRVGANRNFKKKMIFDLIKTCLQFKNLKLVLHGGFFPELARFESEGVIFCKSLVESISYLHRSKLTLCANSGFTAFALNCASNVAVLHPGGFPKQNRDILLGNIFQTYTETIYYHQGSSRYDKEKLILTISRAFNENIM